MSVRPVSTPNLPAASRSKLKELTEKYRNHVFEYKLSPANKAQLRKVIDNLKHDLENFGLPNDKDLIALQKKENEVAQLGFAFDKKGADVRQKLLADVMVMQERFAEKERLLYSNAFEWRFEFPEVLDEAGEFVGFDAVIGKPFLRGRDIRKWKANWAGIYLLFIPWHFEIDSYPAIKNHLFTFKDLLDKRGPTEQGRYEWYALQRYAADYFEEFEKLKIVYQEIATYQSFAYADPGTFCNNKCFLIPDKDDYLLALLNSKLIWWVICNLTSALTGGARAMQTPYVAQLPIPTATTTQQAPITALVEQILAAPDSPDVPQLEAEIDRLVYALYDLTEEEIALVEGKGP